MPNSMHDDDALIRTMGRIPVIRALLASRSWPYMSSLSVSERDRALDEMALREFRAEQRIYA
jgi:hypothetical protein